MAEYIVRMGDDWPRIAKNHKVPLDVLRRLNGGILHTLWVGFPIFVPDKEQEMATTKRPGPTQREMLGRILSELSDVKLSLLNPRPQTQVIKHEYSPEPKPREYRVMVTSEDGCLVGQYTILGSDGSVDVRVPAASATRKVPVKRRWWHIKERYDTETTYIPERRFRVDIRAIGQ